jgi:hypothetical protein
MDRIKKLGGILKNKYKNAPQGEKVTQIYLFAIFYAPEIQQNKYSVSEIVRNSSIGQSFATEVSKGIKLSSYVEITNEPRILKPISCLELVQILQSMYKNAVKNETTNAVRLFGVRYAMEIKSCQQSIVFITTSAGLSKNYSVEISKGIKLEKYVKCKISISKMFNLQNINSEIVKPIIKSRFKKLQETGLQAETYFINNYNDIDIFKGGKLQDARLFGDGYDFQIDTDTGFYLAEVKGIKENKGRFRLTENEYQKAVEYKNDYIITLVLNLNKNPRFLQVENPIKNLNFKERKINSRVTKEYQLIDNIS